MKQLIYKHTCTITNKSYIGQSIKSMEERLKRHNGELKTKPSAYTRKNFGKWDVIYKEEFKTRSEAIKREKQLKSYQGRLFIKNL